LLEKLRERLKLTYWCVRRLLEGEDVQTIRLAANVSRRTLYYWLERFQRNGVEGPIEKPRRPHRIRRLGFGGPISLSYVRPLTVASTLSNSLEKV